MNTRPNRPPVEALDDCLDRLAAGEAPDAILAGHPAERDALAPLLAAADLVRADRRRPDAAFRSRSRAQLVARATARSQAPIFRQPLRQAAAFAALAACIVLFVGSLLRIHEPAASTVKIGRATVAPTGVPRAIPPTAVARVDAPDLRPGAACPGGPGCPATRVAPRTAPGPGIAAARQVVVVVPPPRAPEPMAAPPSPVPAGPFAPVDDRKVHHDSPVATEPASTDVPATTVAPSATPASDAPSPASPAAPPSATVVTCAGVIAGKVRDYLGRPVGSGEVTAYADAGDGAGVRPTALSRADGEYRIAGLCPGAYLLVAQVDGPMALVGVYDPDGNGVADPVLIATDATSAGDIDIALTGSAAGTAMARGRGDNARARP